MNNEKLLDITWKTIIKIAITVVCLYVLFSIKEIIIWFVFALIISILFNPIIDFFQKFKIPRALAVIFVYLGIFGIISMSVYSIVPMFSEEIQQFSENLPEYFEKIIPSLKNLKIQGFDSAEQFMVEINSVLEKMASNVFNTLFVIFGGIFSTLFVITLAIFLSLEKKSVQEGFALFFPKEHESTALSIWKKTQKRVNLWFLTRVIACLFVGLASLLTFLIFQIKYPFFLAFLAAIFNFVPIIGPIVIGIIIFIIVALSSFTKALFIVGAFIIIQQLEGNFITPAVSKKIIGISPALVLIALVVGAKMWGFLGAVLAVPLFAIVFGFLKDFLKKRKESRDVAAPLVKESLQEGYKLIDD